MKRSFVAGILIEGDIILLVKRAAEDPYMGNLWSLPGGGIEATESPKEALIREFKEETNLDVKILRKLFVFKRTSVEVTIFQVSRISGSLQSNDSEIEKLAFFELNKMPEKISIDSLLCILKYQILKGNINEHFSITIDKVFASIFYSYLSTQFRSFDFSKEAIVYKYIIESTPYRKFKSVVPFLLSNNCNPKKKYLFIIPELCYAVWTLLDDCHDEKFHRYEIESSLKKFGIKMSVIALFKANHNLKYLFSNKISNSNINEINSSLIQSATILYQRDLNGIDMNIEKYLKQSTKRTEFLRTSWKVVLNKIGYDSKKIELVYNFQKQSSEIGQLINDYFDLIKGDLEDFEKKATSMHLLLLYREANGKDKKLISFLWAGNDSGKNKYKTLILKYNIKGILHQIIKEKLENIIKHIQNSDLDSDEKCILVAWHQMSFIHFKKEVESTDILSKFLESINMILYNS